MFGDAAETLKAGTNKILNDLAQVSIGLAFNADYTEYLKPGVAYDIALMYSSFNGNESQSSLAYRGYSFESHVGELSAKILFEPISFLSNERMLFDPYATLGVGVVSAHVPTWSFTENSGRPNLTDKLHHKTLGLSGIGGLGLKFPITPSFDVRIEITYHTTTTDYLDGYHPLASKHNDLLILSLIKICYHYSQDKRVQRFD
jgi:opacity protein-like surface antigen